MISEAKRLVAWQCYLTVLLVLGSLVFALGTAVGCLKVVAQRVLERSQEQRLKSRSSHFTDGEDEAVRLYRRQRSGLKSEVCVRIPAQATVLLLRRMVLPLLGGGRLCQ